ncbi:hypothetical protein BE17_41080 [Sorangium cellulosum]|uniref:Uncharacterized protein n=1 Tax=Sorangium cellulosum TaxID=56 RepID=A0A150SIH0_SORCE|nr:hypothetical protein BE17_41080 [Sorangium cellulosum]
MTIVLRIHHSSRGDVHQGERDGVEVGRDGAGPNSGTLPATRSSRASSDRGGHAELARPIPCALARPWCRGQLLRCFYLEEMIRDAVHPTELTLPARRSACWRASSGGIDAAVRLVE